MSRAGKSVADELDWFFKPPKAKGRKAKEQRKRRGSGRTAAAASLEVASEDRGSAPSAMPAGHATKRGRRGSASDDAKGGSAPGRANQEGGAGAGSSEERDGNPGQVHGGSAALHECVSDNDGGRPGSDEPGAGAASQQSILTPAKDHTPRVAWASSATGVNAASGDPATPATTIPESDGGGRGRRPSATTPPRSSNGGSGAPTRPRRTKPPRDVVVTPFSSRSVTLLEPPGARGAARDGAFPPDLRSGGDDVIVFVDNSNIYLGASLAKVRPATEGWMRGAATVHASDASAKAMAELPRARLREKRAGEVAPMRHRVDRAGLAPRRSVRIDVPQIVRFVEARRPAAMRVVACGNVAPAAPIVAAWEREGYQVVVGEMSGRREATVDDMLVTAAMAAVRSRSPSARGRRRTLVLVSGDGNVNRGRMSLYDVVTQALAAGWRVEVVAWAASVSVKYGKLAEASGGALTVRLLDDVREDVTFDEAGARGRGAGVVGGAGSRPDDDGGCGGDNRGYGREAPYYGGPPSGG
eukprot:CAMPEP_0203808706 /NCGR_PEP_ID=MMETSP0115-20131106/1761_1 /ASSEMBLY_ACC=CAM_ASM_000227 /TAXON_ID=33651 /ORGANISM="Bicosoecid sp, Strain ms1" /LENGTH=526 /DNA_ID=CAMNT_0050717399 /DNA_START=50 /DNA_END=1626 /DNA_ORIENTATION=+